MLGSALAWLRLSCILPGLLRTASFRINPIFFSSLFFLLLFFFGGGVEISLYSEFQLPRLPGSRTFTFRFIPIRGPGRGGGARWPQFLCSYFFYRVSQNTGPTLFFSISQLLQHLGIKWRALWENWVHAVFENVQNLLNWPKESQNI
jgi:hypothetical protein